MSNPPDVVAIINSNPDVVDMLGAALETAGIVVVSTFPREINEGRVILEDLVRQHDPKVILFDVALPYEANWQLFQHLALWRSCAGACSC